MLALIDAAGFRTAANLSEMEFAAALIAGLMPPAVGLVNGVPHWSSDQASTFIANAERDVLARHSAMANLLISGASEVRSMHAANAAQVTRTIAASAPTTHTIAEPHDDERFPEDMAADYLGMSAEVLRLAREGGTGPAWTKNGTGKVIYRFGDLRAFQAERDRIDTHAHTNRPNLTIHDAARYCGYTVETFKSFTKPSSRAFGKGPAFVKVSGKVGQRGGRIEWRPDDLDAWLAAHHKGNYRSTEAKATADVPKPKPDKRMTSAQATKYLKLGEGTLGYFRQNRDHDKQADHGPAYIRDESNRVFYMRSELDAWKEKRGDATRVLSPAGRAAVVANIAKARAKRLANLAKKKKANRVTVGQGAIEAEGEARSSIRSKIEECGTRAEAFPLNEALTHGKATLADKLGVKTVLKAGSPNAHSRMPVVPPSD